MKILAPAKINLFLQVTGKRPDGYHDLFTLMCCIGLYDTVRLNFGTAKTTVSCTHPEVPEDETNLACRAAGLFFEALDKREGVEIFIDKQIPVAAGLGGGSSNASAVLTGLNRYYGYPLSTEELLSLGLSIGADVPFLIFGKPALATGVGEKLVSYSGLPPLQVLVVYPGFSVSTAAVYKNLNLALTKCEKKLKDSHLKCRDFDVDHHLCNDLETVTASMHPEITAIKEALLIHGARGALMSGSGSSVFGLFSDTVRARNAYHRLSENNPWQVFLVDLLV